MKELTVNEIFWLVIAVQLLIIFFQASVIKAKSKRIRELTSRKARVKPKRGYLIGHGKHSRSIWDLFND